MEKVTVSKVPCQGGLIRKDNWIQLSDYYPGFATALRNFEPSLFGGYRRINGHEPINPLHPVVNPSGAEGKILGVFIYKEKILAARKDIGSNTYSFYEFVPGFPWQKISNGYSPVSTDVNKVRYDTFNFDGTEKAVFVDGVNPPVCYDDSSWTVLSGDQLDTLTPRYVSVFQNHIFVSGDKTFPHIVAHSAPTDETTWTAAAGAGQIIAGFDVYQIYPWRERLIVFGQNQIKNISVSNTTFVIDSITKKLGLVSSDAVVEANGDLLFLSTDGIRPLEATERNQDFELNSLSKNIQEVFKSTQFRPDRENVNTVVIKEKSQVRFFVADDLMPENMSRGVLGGLMTNPQGVGWEWAEILGIKVSCTESDIIGVEEYVLHGSFDGIVHRQDTGDSFDGQPINALYQTPYLDFDSPLLRKTVRRLTLFVRPEGDVNLDVGVSFDWGDKGNMNSMGPDYLFNGESSSYYYNQSLYNQTFYTGRPLPFIMNHIVGSGRSVRFSFSSNNTLPSFSIQTLLIEITQNGNE